MHVARCMRPACVYFAHFTVKSHLLYCIVFETALLTNISSMVGERGTGRDINKATRKKWRTQARTRNNNRKFLRSSQFSKMQLRCVGAICILAVESLAAEEFIRFAYVEKCHARIIVGWPATNLPLLLPVRHPATASAAAISQAVFVNFIK